MPNIDIPLSVDLNDALRLPPCNEIRVPLPKPLKIQLPTGGSIQAIADISKGIPSDCAMTFSLMVQIAPLLASMECLVKILKLLKPLVDVVSNLPMPPVKALQEFAKAAVDLAPCFLVPTPASMIPFVRDILCLILRVLNCLLGQLKTLVALMGSLRIQLDAARAAGNFELEEALQCAQENAEASGQHMTKAIEPIGVLLDLVGPMMGIAGVEPITLPSLGDQASLDALQSTIQTLQGVVGTIDIAVEALGGCPS
jgi:hypothetical protein